MSLVWDLFAGVPPEERSFYHGCCAEADALQTLERKHQLASLDALRAMTNGSSWAALDAYGRSVPPCSSCRHVLGALGIEWSAQGAGQLCSSPPVAKSREQNCDGDRGRQAERFDRAVRVEALPFATIMDLVVCFVANYMFFLRETGRIGTDASIAEALKRFVLDGIDFLKSGASRAETLSSRVAAIELQRLADVECWSLLDLVILCLFDEESAEFATFGPEPMIEALMSAFSRLGEDVHAAFVDHAIKRIKDGAPELLRPHAASPDDVTSLDRPPKAPP